MYLPTYHPLIYYLSIHPYRYIYLSKQDNAIIDKMNNFKTKKTEREEFL